MNSLIIKAHPRADGFTHQIAETYKKKLKIVFTATKCINVEKSLHSGKISALATKCDLSLITL